MAILRGRDDDGAGGTRDTNRLEAFSDGVIAIAITLLIIEIHVPSLTETDDGEHLWSHLWDLWPNYLGYLISFIVIGIMWANHHNIFKYIARVDHYLILINTLLLLFIGFVPFTTALLAEYLKSDGERIATIVYMGWFFATALVYNLLWRYASRWGNLLDPDADPAAIATINRRFNLGPPSYAAAFIAAFIYPPAGLAIFFALALLYALPSQTEALGARR